MNRRIVWVDACPFDGVNLSACLEPLEASSKWELTTDMATRVELIDTYTDADDQRNPAPPNAEVVDLLRRVAKRKGQALTWNRNVLLAAYAVLTATVVVALHVQNAWVIAPAAVLGLIMIWAFNGLQSKRLQAQSLEEEIRDYDRLAFASSTAIESPEPASPPVPSVESPLSCREVEVLRQIATGKSNKQAALDLYISEQTVKNHIKHIFTKLEVGDRSSAILLGVRNGWIDAGIVGRWRKSWAGEEVEEPSIR